MKKIMIVDDEQVSLMMTEHILATAYQTVCASNGKEAIELFHKEIPDMVLSDLHMPGMTGYELQQKLQKEFNEQIPFMFMTADQDDATESKGFENGAMDFIKKPFRADVLLRRVGNILQTVEKIQGLKKAAVLDPMTGLLNKASSQEEISALCKSAQGVLMMIDLDSFKLVNDIYGHSMGDKILARFSEILKAVVRPIDLVGRLGGDEFIAFCQNITEEIVVEKKSRFINKYILEAAKELMGEDFQIPLGASIGCVFVPNEGTDFDRLFKKADKALYDVKKNGKHGFKFFKEKDSERKNEETRASDLANAMQILSERTPPRGALVLPFEQFKTVFQFLKRLVANYQREVWAVLFSISETERSAIPIEDAAEQLLDAIKSSLRQSDVVSQNAKNQFMVLLQEVESSNIEIVINRIMEKWEAADASVMFTVKSELDAVKRA